MPRFLFWNYQYAGQDREDLLARLVHHEDIDVVILAESSCDRKKLVDRLSASGRSYHLLPSGYKRFQIFAGYSSEVFQGLRDFDRLCLVDFKIPGRQSLTLGAVHLESGLHLDAKARKDKAAPLARDIRQIQSEKGHARTIIVGDFNMNPFDDGMISTEGFGAMLTKSLVKKNVLSRDSRFERFYNPIWKLLGLEAEASPPGTYYWNKHEPSSIYWNYIDQVLLGHDILDYFAEDQFRIVTSIPGENGPQSLFRPTPRHWKIEYSDHLPLIFEVDLPMESGHESES